MAERHVDNLPDPQNNVPNVDRDRNLGVPDTELRPAEPILARQTRMAGGAGGGDDDQNEAQVRLQHELRLREVLGRGQEDRQ